LVRRLCLALDIAALAVKTAPADGHANPGDPSHNVRPEKLVGEASLLLLAAAHAASRSEVRERIDSVARLLVPLARAERVRARICLEPSLALEHALGHVCLSRLGFPDRALDRLLRESLEADCAGGGERLPHRQLEQEWMLRVWGAPPRGAQVESGHLRRSALARPSDLLSARKDQAYAFTHALMYLTDLGSRRVRLPRSQSTIAAEADAALASSLDEPDYDLSGELLLTWPYLHRRWSASAIVSFAILASVEDRLGFLPAPNLSLDALNGLSGDDRSRYVAASSYHTAFVMGLLCAGSLRDGCRPPLAAPIPARGRGAAAKLLELIGPAEPKPDWQAHVQALRPEDQDAVAPLLLNICLRRAAVRRDLGVIRSALLVGQQYGLLDAPAPRQAAELLSRSATYASIQSEAASDSRSDLEVAR
jgi:hypothetical protein